MAGVADVTLYTTPMCPYCRAAKDLLRQRAAAFIEIDVRTDPELRSEMIARAGGGRTVPQIFIGERHIGGFTDLYALEHSGELERLLSQARSAE